MKKLIPLVTVVVFLSASCSWWHNDVVTPVDNTIDCVAQQETPNINGTPTAQVVEQILGTLGAAALTAFLSGGVTAIAAAVIAASDPLIAKWGGPIVACVQKDLGSSPIITALLSQKATVGPTATPAHNPVDDVLQHYNWHYKQ